MAELAVGSEVAVAVGWYTCQDIVQLPSFASLSDKRKREVAL